MASNLSVRVNAVYKQYVHKKKTTLCQNEYFDENKTRPFKHVALLFQIVVDSNCRCGFEGI